MQDEIAERRALQLRAREKVREHREVIADLVLRIADWKNGETGRRREKRERDGGF